MIPFHVVDLAVGGELELPINYYDTLGNTLLHLCACFIFLMYFSCKYHLLFCVEKESVF